MCLMDGIRTLNKLAIPRIRSHNTYMENDLYDMIRISCEEQYDECDKKDMESYNSDEYGPESGKAQEG